ncbi:TonB-dependent receptor domain-containing protein, partial [Enterobacter hormaechei]|uniref:TonB-dependent receptor domain-containing protein n=1 Tax=Enterobacter hormaechei TaxID=158836 RepID=UPI00203EACE7
GLLAGVVDREHPAVVAGPRVLVVAIQAIAQRVVVAQRRGEVGLQSSTTPLLIPDRSAFHASTLALYVQDEWKIGDDWTVNYGLRGDRYKAF